MDSGGLSPVSAWKSQIIYIRRHFVCSPWIRQPMARKLVIASGYLRQAHVTGEAGGAVRRPRCRFWWVGGGVG